MCHGIVLLDGYILEALSAQILKERSSTGRKSSGVQGGETSADEESQETCPKLTVQEARARTCSCSFSNNDSMTGHSLSGHASRIL